MTRLLNILIAIDQLVYVLITLGKGQPDETLSSAAFRTERDGRILGRIFRPIIDTLFRPFEKNHCRNSYFAEVFRTQGPK